ncbi:hypothetical protein BC939DRAFT_195770 [Gamsiella multidivaricata]|uniref:uncharacterized protein n=1 Tax=Gamsiella multidivaricata TaxID=101098 RepID=UPI00221FD145|nr:uncharacterized protein BC939DRAFT_195770 [Gamsiella multidivaricata]KAI7822017.1 hypothetical protein BC939DRAFT_195770 [Gamsiella multidivaricata]
MKNNDGSFALSKKRKTLAKHQDRFEGFTRYGMDADEGDLQDENEEDQNTLGPANGKGGNKSAAAARRKKDKFDDNTTPAKKHKTSPSTPPAKGELMKYFTRMTFSTQSSTHSPDGTATTTQIMAGSKPEVVPQSKGMDKQDDAAEEPEPELSPSRRRRLMRTSDMKAMEATNDDCKSTRDDFEAESLPQLERLPESRSGINRFFGTATLPTPSITGTLTNTTGGLDNTFSQVIDSSEDSILNAPVEHGPSKPKCTTASTNKKTAHKRTFTSNTDRIEKDFDNNQPEQNLSELLDIKVDDKQKSAQRTIASMFAKVPLRSAPSSSLWSNYANDTSDTHYDASKSTKQPATATQPAKKPRSKPGSARAKTKKTKASSFSDSEGPGSDIDSKGSDDDHLSAANTKADEKANSNQIPITAMFSKATLHPGLSDNFSSGRPKNSDCEPNGVMVIRSTLKTYSGRNVRSAARKQREKGSFFERSEPSDSNNDSDSDLSDFMDTKIDDKPDPNQRSITTMFSKASYSPIVKVYRRRYLSPRSRCILSGGLSNLSNTCYLNSVLQSLRNTVDCANTLFSIQDKIQAIEKALDLQINVTEYQRMLFSNALKVFQALDLQESRDNFEVSNEISVYPREVIQTLHQGDSLFNSSEQQDAAEFLFYIISLFDDIFKALIQLCQEAPLESRNGVRELIPEDWQPIDELFQVGTQTVTHCRRCPSVSVKLDRGIDLTVQIDAENPTLVRDLDWGISETMKMEHMKDDNQRFCEKCNSKEDAHVYHFFTSLPKILILRLQRYNFKEGAMKLQNGVSCTERLGFGKWMSLDYKGSEPEYELCAIIIHRGRVITSGHYYVYIKKDVEIVTVIMEQDGGSTTETKSYQWYVTLCSPYLKCPCYISSLKPFSPFRLKYNDSNVEPISDEDMAKVFFGDVGAQASKDIVSNSSTSAGAGTGSSGSDDGEVDAIKKEIASITSAAFDYELATPYVYVYRRIDPAH